LRKISGATGKKSVNVSEEEEFTEKTLMSLQSLCSYFYSHANRTEVVPQSKEERVVYIMENKFTTWSYTSAYRKG